MAGQQMMRTGHLSPVGRPKRSDGGELSQIPPAVHLNPSRAAHVPPQTALAPVCLSGTCRRKAMQSRQHIAAPQAGGSVVAQSGGLLPCSLMPLRSSYSCSSAVLAILHLSGTCSAHQHCRGMLGCLRMSQRCKTVCIDPRHRIRDCAS